MIRPQLNQELRDELTFPRHRFMLMFRQREPLCLLLAHSTHFLALLKLRLERLI